MKYIKLTSLLILCSCSLAFAQCAKIDSLYRILYVAKKPVDSINTLNTLAEVYLQIGRKDQASLAVTKSLQMAEKIRYEKGIADALSHVAIMNYKDLEEASGSMERYQKALEIYEKLGDQEKTVKMLKILGAYYTKSPNQANHLKAINHYEKAVEISRELPHNVEKAKLYENIGWLYSQLEKDQKAIKAFEQANEIRKELGLESPANSRILAKYRRISAIEQKIQQTDTFLLVTIFGIITTILAIITFISLRRQARTSKVLKELQKKKGQVEV